MITVSARTSLSESSPVFAALGAAVSSPTPYYLVAIAATTALAAGLWLRFVNSR